jgi:hypothetical protein
MIVNGMKSVLGTSTDERKCRCPAIKLSHANVVMCYSGDRSVLDSDKA